MPKEGRNSAAAPGRSARSGGGRTDARTPLRPHPPAAPYQVFKSVLWALKEQDCTPADLDPGSPGYRKHNAHRPEILNALRFFGLVDDAGIPMPRLADLTASLGTPQWPVMLGRLITDGYAALFGTAAVTLSGGALLPGFRSAYQTQGSVTRRAAEFFMHAAREAALGIEHVQPNNRRRSQSGLASGGEDSRPASSLEAGRIATVKALLTRLPDFDATWPDDVKALWFKAYVELVQRLQTDVC